MTARYCVLSGLIAGLVACSPQDKRETRDDLRKTGNAVKKELKNDAAFLKEEALKARQETQKGVQKLKKDMATTTKTDKDSRSSRTDSPDR